MPTIRSDNMSETATLATKQNPLQYVTEQLNELRAKGVAPKFRILEGEQKPVCIFDGREVINLASNNYLGLTTHKALRKAALDAVKRYGVGAGAVRTIAGTMRLHIELEEQVAAFKNVEACVVFQSGFTANAGTVAAVLGKEDLIISDELNHASIIDGARLSKATIKVFKHKDVKDCERILQENANFPGKKLIITDGVFSMGGDIAPLPELCELAEKYNCIMMVDDAHASGVLGRGGRGTVDHHQCHGRVHIQVGTLSKAIGAMGGYVCGSRELIDFLYLRARPLLPCMWEMRPRLSNSRPNSSKRGSSRRPSVIRPWRKVKHACAPWRARPIGASNFSPRQKFWPPWRSRSASFRLPPGRV